MLTLPKDFGRRKNGTKQDMVPNLAPLDLRGMKKNRRIYTWLLESKESEKIILSAVSKQNVDLNFELRQS